MIFDLIFMVADTAPAAGSSTSEILIYMLGAGGLSAIFAAIIAGLFSKRKLGAEATEIITRAASGVTERLESELNRADQKAERREREYNAERQIWEQKIDAMAAAHVAERGEWRRVLQLHVAWDAIALAKLDEIGIELPPVPPVTPANRYVDESGHPLPTLVLPTN